MRKHAFVVSMRHMGLYAMIFSECWLKGFAIVVFHLLILLQQSVTITLVTAFRNLFHACYPSCNEIHEFSAICCQVQAVLLLLGERDTPTAVPTFEVPYAQSTMVCRWLFFRELTVSYV